MLFEAVPLKLLPVMDTALPGTPETGLILIMTGAAQNPIGTKAQDAKTDSD
jgi:hypothetical protein